MNFFYYYKTIHIVFLNMLCNLKGDFCSFHIQRSVFSSMFLKHIANNQK